MYGNCPDCYKLKALFYGITTEYNGEKILISAEDKAICRDCLLHLGAIFLLRRETGLEVGLNSFRRR